MIYVERDGFRFVLVANGIFGLAYDLDFSRESERAREGDM